MFANGLFNSQHRTWPESHRVLHVGDLSVRSGAVELLIAASVWAENHPGRSLDIWWLGEGDLRELLARQPLPRGVTQTFLGELDRSGCRKALAACGLLVVPSVRLKDPRMIDEALMMGLVVLGNHRNAAIRKSVVHSRNGWVFDRTRHDAMGAALAHALNLTDEALDLMRSPLAKHPKALKSSATARSIRAALAGLLRHEDTPLTETVQGSGPAL